MPSLYANRGRRSHSQNDVDPTETDTPAVDPSVDARDPESPDAPTPINGSPFTSRARSVSLSG